MNSSKLIEIVDNI